MDESPVKATSGHTRSPHPLLPLAPTRAAGRVRRPVALGLALLLLGNLTLPVVAQAAQAPAPAQAGPSGAGGAGPPAGPGGPAPGGPAAPTEPPAQGSAAQDPEAKAADSLSAASSASSPSTAPPLTTFAVEAFQTDLFTGAVSAELPLVVPPGTAGVAPKLTLRYHSGTVDELPLSQQGQGTGLGWTLEAGGVVLRDTKNSVSTGDDTFTLVFGGEREDLVLVDGTGPQHRYRTQDEHFWRIEFTPAQDTWTLTTKDGTVHRFGPTPASQARTWVYQNVGGSLQEAAVTYKYLLEEVRTTRGTALRYTYARVSATDCLGRAYDQAVYLDTISYTSHQGTPVGPARTIRLRWTPRTDWTDTSATTCQAYVEREALAAVEMRVAGTLFREYRLTTDYAVDRDPTTTWGGGASGDLTLTAVTLAGTDGSTLPPITFTYSGASLSEVNNGIGGRSSFTTEALTTRPLYNVCRTLAADGSCAEWGVGSSPDAWGKSTLLGHLLQPPLAGTSPVYAVCLQLTADGTQCAEWGAGTSPDAWGHSTFLGHAPTTPLSGTRPLYSSCRERTPDGTACAEWQADTTSDPWGFSTLLGHVYREKVERRRVVSRTMHDGRSASVATTYSYRDLALSANGKEFRGHGAVRAVDPLGHYTDTWFHQDDARKGRAFTVETRSSGDALYTRVDNTWSTTLPAPGVTVVLLSRAETTTCDGDATCQVTAQTFAYDTYGNVTAVHHLGDVTVTGDERTDRTTYALQEAAHIVGLPATAFTEDASGATVAQTWFHYDGAASPTTPPTVGNLTRRCQWLKEKQAGEADPCVTIAYDAYGNVTATTDGRGFTTTTTYDTTYQTFPERVVSPPTPNVPGGLVSTATYDPRFGHVTASTDPNGHISTSTYDAFGRPTATTNPLGETTTISYDAFGTVGQQRITTRLPDGSPDGLWSESYFDGLGRTFLTRKEAAGGMILQESTVDARGLPERQSLPRFAGEPPLWTTLRYDPVGRPSETRFPDDTTETTSYNDRTITVTDREGRQRTSIQDAYGRTVQVIEPGGPRTTYAYDVLGRLRQVTDAASNVTTITYDTLGRKVSMTEPNMGSWSYTYDANGNLRTQTDAKGQTLTFTYDSLNRLEQKRYPDAATITFTYDTGVNGQGRRARMTDRVGVATYTYDALGRPTSTTRTIDGLSYTTQTTYTTLGQVETLTYPDGEVVRTTYDAGGQVFAVTGATPYVTRMTYTASGQVASVTYGNGLTSTWSYDPKTLRLARLQTVTSASPLVPLQGWSKSWAEAPHAYAPVGQGQLCVANAAGTCVGSDLKAAPGASPRLGYLKTSAEAGTLPAYLGPCYSDATGACRGFGLSLEATSGPLLGYLAGSPPDAASESSPLTASGGLLYQGYPGGSAAAYLWSGSSLPLTTAHTDHHYTGGEEAAPAGYGSDGLLGFLHQAAEPGTVPLLRFRHPATGHHFYGTSVSEAPLGFVLDRPLGYLAANPPGARLALSRDHHPSTGAYQLSTAGSPAPGATRQATLGYLVAYLQDLAYATDAVGNITAITDLRTPSQSQAFTYDPLDRLTQAAGAYGSETYSYDAIGNLLAKAGITYTYGATAQTCQRLMPHAVTATSDGKTYTYDCNGNLLADGERTVTWDPDNKPTAITRTGVGTTTFAYSGEGARLQKVGPTGTIIHYLGAFEAHVTDGAQLTTIAAGPLKVATRVTGGVNAGTYFVHGDHLGSLQVLTNAQGAEVQRLTYKPWGETHTNTGAVDFAPRRFTGQIQDPETGLYFYNARYYNPTLGRFLSPDPLVPGLGNPQTLNRYSYVTNNPVNFTDPTGHFKFKKLFKKLLPIAVGIVVAIATAGWGAPVAGMLAGMSAGVTGAALNGGNILQGALMGGFFGTLGGAMAPGLFGSLGGVAGAGFWANLGPTLGTAAILGAGFGGLQAALGGGSILEGMAVGALTSAAVAAAVYGGIELYHRINQSPVVAEATGRHQSPHREMKPAAYDPGNAQPAQAWPTESYEIAWDDFYTSSHPAADVRNGLGSPVRAMVGGEVVGTRVGTPGGLDSFVQIRGIDRYHDVYAHVRPAPGITPGLTVAPGQVIGFTDLSGTTSGPHLHYELRMPGNGPNLNPALRLRSFGP